ncbi:VOC family protein [Streptomyces sp. NBC_01239]|uniref:VOC family protein n=1 Tax=Streptomyces sp. NBC_01239 TaxID=2903792 RepID=UPI00225569DB|nr:VOC family protein [Streptomyces sp. NBC_01239]MCX4816476.1 VOC family protein [Streptomyces sp. NBC_01239]
MSVLNHQIVWSRDAETSARFLADMLAFEPPVKLGHFMMVKVSPDITFDFMTTNRDIMAQHYAFLVSEAEFDVIIARVREQGLEYWADPRHQDAGTINRLDDGLGVYFNDPSGHELEIITRPYGSGGLAAEHVNPLLVEELTASGKLPDLS